MRTIELVNHQMTDRHVIGKRAEDSANPFGVQPLSLTTEQRIEIRSLVNHGELAEALEYIVDAACVNLETAKQYVKTLL